MNKVYSQTAGLAAEADMDRQAKLKSMFEPVSFVEPSFVPKVLLFANPQKFLDSLPPVSIIFKILNSVVLFQGHRNWRKMLREPGCEISSPNGVLTWFLGFTSSLDLRLACRFEFHPAGNMATGFIRHGLLLKIQSLSLSSKAIQERLDQNILRGFNSWWIPLRPVVLSRVLYLRTVSWRGNETFRMDVFGRTGGM